MPSPSSTPRKRPRRSPHAQSRQSPRLLELKAKEARDALLSLCETDPEILESLPDLPTEYYDFSDGLERRLCRNSHDIIGRRPIVHNAAVTSRLPPSTRLISLPKEILILVFMDLDEASACRFFKASTILYNSVTQKDIDRLEEKRAEIMTEDEDLEALDLVTEDANIWDPDESLDDAIDRLHEEYQIWLLYLL